MMRPYSGLIVRITSNANWMDKGPGIMSGDDPKPRPRDPRTRAAP